MVKIIEKFVFIENYLLKIYFSLQTVCYVVPVKEHRHLTINWVVPDHKALYYCNVSISLVKSSKRKSRFYLA